MIIRYLNPQGKVPRAMNGLSGGENWVLGAKARDPIVGVVTPKYP